MDKTLRGLLSAYLSKLICCTRSSLLSPPAKMAYCPQLCQAPSYLKEFAHAASPAWTASHLTLPNTHF